MRFLKLLKALIIFKHIYKNYSSHSWIRHWSNGSIEKIKWNKKYWYCSSKAQFWCAKAKTGKKNEHIEKEQEFLENKFELLSQAKVLVSSKKRISQLSNPIEGKDDFGYSMQHLQQPQGYGLSHSKESCWKAFRGTRSSLCPW